METNVKKTCYKSFNSAADSWSFVTNVAGLENLSKDFPVYIQISFQTGMDRTWRFLEKSVSCKPVLGREEGRFSVA